MKRYKPIIDDWEAFKAEAESHAVNTVRKNNNKAGKDFEEELRESFETVERSEWNSEVFRLKGTKTPGKSILHWRGEYYVQEESASIPVEILNPQPDEEILDLCSAPGGKTTQMASKIENNGLIVANDASAKRMQSLQSNVYRTGSFCVRTTNYDGRNFPSEKFDRVLVDAPCSGEGNRFRRSFESADSDELRDLAELQKGILERGIELTRENGVIVYSTCTFAPEENEAVIDYIIEERDDVELCSIDVDFPHREGVTEFEEMEFSEEVSKCVRVYPHHLKSGGIFVAKLRKIE